MKQAQQKSLFDLVKKSPLFIAIGVAVTVVFVVSFVGYARRGGFWSPAVEARVFTTENARRAGEAARSNQRVFAFQGEVYSDVERLREASAIAVGGMLAAANRKLERQPLASVESVLGGMKSSGLMPPGITMDSAGKVLSSVYGSYYVRYRQEPLGIEVVSVCTGQLCGPAILIRLPDDQFSQDALTYYTAPAVGKPVPAPFAAPVEILRAGWRPVTYKAASVPQDEVEKGRQFLGR